MLVGFILSWDVALVGFSPLLILIPVGLLEVVYFGRYEGECEKPMARATSYASESIDAIRVSPFSQFDDGHPLNPLLILTTLPFHQTVAAFGRENYIIEEFDRLQQPDVEAHRTSLALGSICFGLGQACIMVVCVLVLWYGGEKYGRGEISITGEFVSSSLPLLFPRF